jgi:cytochrome b pre-mRNA-processing protein 3
MALDYDAFDGAGAGLFSGPLLNKARRMGQLTPPVAARKQSPDDARSVTAMIFSLFRKSTATEAVYAVYSAIVAQSRRPVFYAEWAVPDSVTGRFDMICLHLALVFRRLRSSRKDVIDFSQALFDLFFRDMDRSLREMGVGDLGVPKKIQKMGNVFYGLLAKLNEAIDAGDRDAVRTVVLRNVYDNVETAAAGRLTDYLFDEAARLSTLTVEDILSGRLEAEVAA